MIKNNEPYLIEYNIRMGDPECQVTIRLKTDLVSIIIKAISNKLKSVNIKWKKKEYDNCPCAKGYPGKYKKNLEIKNLGNLNLFVKDFIYHAGTKLIGDEILSNGGRVLNITSIGNNFLKIRKRIISIIHKLNWKSGFFRKDIGYKVINKNANN